MAWTSLSTSERITILLQLVGGPQFRGELGMGAKELDQFRRSVHGANRAMMIAQRQSFLFQQSLFTLRRMAFAATGALTLASAGLVKLGYDYLSARDKAATALKPLISNQTQMNSTLDELFRLSRFSPFVLSDLTKSFQALYISLQPQGVTPKGATALIESIMNYLSAIDQVSPRNMKMVTNALSDLAYQGYLSGRMVQRLGQIGLPIEAILRTQFGLSEDAMGKIKDQHITAQQTIAAIIEYSKINPAIRNAAYRQATGTLSGLFAVLVDTLSQLSGLLLGPLYTAAEKKLLGLVGKGGLLDRMIAFAQAGNVAGAFIELNKALAGRYGGVAIGRALLAFWDLLKGLWAFMSNIFIPGMLYGLGAVLIMLAPLFYVLGNALEFFSEHAWALRFLIAYLTVRLVIYHGTTLLVALGSRVLAAQTGFLATQMIWLSRVLWTRLVPAFVRSYIVIRINTILMILHNRAALGLRTTLWLLASVMYGALIPAFIRTRIAMILTSIATLGLRGAFVALMVSIYGAATAMVIFLLTNPVGWAILLIGALAILYWRWKRFRDIVNEGAKFLWEYRDIIARLALGLLGPLGLMISQFTMLLGIWRDIYRTVKAVFDIFAHGKLPSGGDLAAGPKSIGQGLLNNLLGPVKFAAGLVGKIPGVPFQQGGVMPYSGWARVGEAGAENVFLPRGAIVAPHGMTSTGMGLAAAGGYGDRPIVVNVQVDRKTIATAVARARQDQEALR